MLIRLIACKGLLTLMLPLINLEILPNSVPLMEECFRQLNQIWNGALDLPVMLLPGIQMVVITHDHVFFFCTILLFFHYSYVLYHSWPN